MKFNPSYFAETETNGVGNMIKSKMISNQKAFHVLSTKIYSDIHVAIIRELSTNAMDSHIEAGKPDLPIEVHLPSDLEPWLSIQDFGVGMDGKTIEGVFSNFFDSTKDNNNSVNGCLGIGSKAPFGYTPNFTIEGIKDGKKYVYGTSISQDGEPGVIPMGVSDTDEQNGAKITIAIKREDFDLFYRAARVVFFAFDVQPVVYGSYQPYPKDRKLIGDNVYHYPKVNASSLGVIMGNVYYRVGSRPEFDNLQVKNVFHGGSVVIHAELGEVDFQPSREEVNYTEKTIKFVQERLTNAREIMLENMKKRFEAIKTDAEKLKFVFEHKGNIIEQNYLAKEIVKLYPFIRNNSSYIGRGEIYLHGYINVDDMEREIDAKVNIMALVPHKIKYENDNRYSEVLAVEGVQLSERQSIDYSSNPVVYTVIQEGKRGVISAAKRWARKNLMDKVSESYIKRTSTVYLVIITPDKEKTIKKQVFLDRFSMDCEKILSCEEVFALEATSEPEAQIKVAKRLHRVSRNGEYAYVLRDTKDIVSGRKFYIPLNGMAPDYDKVNIPKDMTLSKFMSIYDKLETGFKFEETPIYGIMKKDIELLEKDTNWVNLIDFIHEDVKKHTDTISQKLASQSFKSIGKLKKSVDLSNTELDIFISSPSIGKASVIVPELDQTFGINITKKIGEYKKSMQEVLDKYPLLQYIDYTSYFPKAGVEAIKKYMDGVNK